MTWPDGNALGFHSECDRRADVSLHSVEWEKSRESGRGSAGMFPMHIEKRIGFVKRESVKVIDIFIVV